MKKRGRPVGFSPLGDRPMERRKITLHLLPEEWEFIDALSNKSQFIREAIREKINQNSDL